MTFNITERNKSIINTQINCIDHYLSSTVMRHGAPVFALLAPALKILARPEQNSSRVPSLLKLSLWASREAYPELCEKAQRGNKILPDVTLKLLGIFYRIYDSKKISGNHSGCYFEGLRSNRNPQELFGALTIRPDLIRFGFFLDNGLNSTLFAFEETLSLNFDTQGKVISSDHILHPYERTIGFDRPENISREHIRYSQDLKRVLALEGESVRLHEDQHTFKGVVTRTDYQKDGQAILRTVKGNFDDRGNGKCGFIGEVLETFYRKDGRTILRTAKGTFGDRGNGRWGFIGEVLETTYWKTAQTILNTFKGIFGDQGNGTWGFVGEVTRTDYQKNGQTILRAVKGKFGDQGNGTWGFVGEATETTYRETAQTILRTLKGTFGKRRDGTWGFVGEVTRTDYQKNGLTILRAVKGKFGDQGNGMWGFVGKIVCQIENPLASNEQNSRKRPGESLLPSLPSKKRKT